MKQQKIAAFMKSAPSPSRTTTLLHVDHMNDHQGYIKLLRKWHVELDMHGCILFPVNARPRPRHIFVVIDAEACASQEFLKRLRTENVDVNIRGAPCKERQSSVVRQHKALTMCDDPLGEVAAANPGLEVVELTCTRNPESHLPAACEWLLRRRPIDGVTVIENIREFMQDRREKVKRAKVHP